MSVIGVIGSRRRATDADYDLVRDMMQAVWMPSDTFVSGGCEMGGDYFAEAICRSNGWSLMIHYANWRPQGPYGPTNRAAGFERNSLIARDATILIACVADDRTGGTEDTIKKFLRKLRVSEERAIVVGQLLIV